MKLFDCFMLRTVRRKLVFISKLAGSLLILSYIVSVNLESDSEVSFFVWIIFVAAIILAVDFLMGHYISKPVSKLSRSAQRMADLDFSEPCDVSSNDEFGELSVSLNTMSDNLQQAFAKLEAANEQLEKDVEKERRLLAERKELSDALSHEMKTPLGIIRAYAEGLQDESDENKKRRYLEVIIAQTDKMSSLITTLLDLSALESGASALVPKRFDLVELLETVAGRLLLDVPDTRYELQYELPEHSVYVYADMDRMEQVLNNLLVNAAKNVSLNGMIQLSLVEQGGMLRFSVFNQGDVISQENLSKIWEKFYRGHNAQYNGSGLGLAIVAQILSMQNLEYGVNNLPDGVEFFFSIPSVQ